MNKLLNIAPNGPFRPSVFKLNNDEKLNNNTIKLRKNYSIPQPLSRPYNGQWEQPTPGIDPKNYDKSNIYNNGGYVIRQLKFNNIGFDILDLIVYSNSSTANFVSNIIYEDNNIFGTKLKNSQTTIQRTLPFFDIHKEWKEYDS